MRAERKQQRQQRNEQQRLAQQQQKRQPHLHLRSTALADMVVAGSSTSWTPKVINQAIVATFTGELNALALTSQEATVMSTVAMSVVDSWLERSESARGRRTSLYLYHDESRRDSSGGKADDGVYMVGVEFDPITGTPNYMHLADAKAPPSYTAATVGSSDAAGGDRIALSEAPTAGSRSTLTPSSSASSLVGAGPLDSSGTADARVETTV